MRTEVNTGCNVLNDVGEMKRDIQVLKDDIENLKEDNENLKKVQREREIRKVIRTQTSISAVCIFKL